MNFQDWNYQGKPERGRVVTCEVKSGYQHRCIYYNGHNYELTGLTAGQLNEGKVIRWRY